jgi:hypothetical protein
MQQPSKNWTKLRAASFERAHRSIIEKFTPIHSIYAGVCIFYVAGFLSLNLSSEPIQVSWFSASQIVFVAIAAILVPPLTGAVVMLHFVASSLTRLANS